MYECYAYTDPHIQTWRLKGSTLAAGQYQDCYRPGFVRLVKNEFVDYQVDTEKRWMIEVCIFLLNI